MSEAQYRTLQTEIINTELKLKQLNKEVGNASFDKLSKDFKSFGDASIKAGKSMIPFTAVIGGVVAGSVAVGTSFEASMSKIQATMGITDKSSESMKKLKDAARQMGASTEFSATQGAEALNYMALAGYDAEKAIETLPKVLDLATAGGMELAAASDMVTDGLSALGLTNADEFIDKLAVTSQKSNTSIAQLGEAILVVGGTAKILSGGLTEASTLIGIFSDNGIKGAEAGTTLRNVINSLSAPTKDADSTLKKLGITTEDTAGNLLPLYNIMEQLKGSLAGYGTAEQQAILSKIFNKTDLKAIQAILGTTSERYDELTIAIDGSAGASAKMSEIMRDNLKGDFSTTKSLLAEMGISINDTLAPSIKILNQKLQDMFKWFNGLSEGQKNIIIVIGLLVGAIGPLLITIGQISLGISALLPILTAINVAIGGTTGALAILLSPITLVVAAIASLIAIFVTLYKTNENFRTFVNEIWDSIKKIFTDAIDGILDIIRYFSGQFQADFMEMGNKIKDIFFNMFTKLGEVVGTAWEQLKAGFNLLWESITNWFNDLITSAKEIGENILKSIMDGMVGWIANIGSGIVKICNAIVKGFKSFFKISSPSKVTMKIGSQIGEGIAEGIKGEEERVKRATEGISEVIGNVLDDELDNLFSIAGKGAGQSFNNALSMNIPKRIDVNSKSNMSNNPRQAQTINLTQNINNPASNPRALEQQAVRQFGQLLSRRY
jgi:TP901 family phage tail tape measure protein